MDPNEALKKIRELIAELYAGKLESTEPSTLAENLDAHLSALATEMESLDGWLTKGGFLPAEWQRKPAEPTSKGPCTAVVRINTKTMPCEFDAPHPGWAHTTSDSRRTVYWCSDAEALEVVVE